ncbi:MAG: substrate-binding domain-containing protein, partial [Pseudonocardiales bacterium]
SAVTELLNRDPELTAIVCTSDILALGALAEIRQRGLRVPDELRFVLYDDDVVTAESLTAEQRLIEPDEVAQYVTFFDHLHTVATTGPDAATLIHQVAAELRDRRKITR